MDRTKFDFRVNIHNLAVWELYNWVYNEDIKSIEKLRSMCDDIIKAHVPHQETYSTKMRCKSRGTEKIYHKWKKRK